MFRMFKRFDCDTCNNFIEKEDYGLPKGFIHYFNGYTTAHACLDCREKHTIKEGSRRDDLRGAKNAQTTKCDGG